jgi:hypothetical protein
VDLGERPPCHLLIVDEITGRICKSWSGLMCDLDGFGAVEEFLVDRVKVIGLSLMHLATF